MPTNRRTTEDFPTAASPEEGQRMSENVPRYTANKKAMARMYLVGRVSLGQTCPQIQKHRLPCYMNKVWIV